MYFLDATNLLMKKSFVSINGVINKFYAVYQNVIGMWLKAYYVTLSVRDWNFLKSYRFYAVWS